jgi:hypothetical protein
MHPLFMVDLLVDLVLKKEKKEKKMNIHLVIEYTVFARCGKLLCTGRGVAANVASLSG